MLKKIVKDERGSAFVLAVLVMLITVILCASFMDSVSTATRLEANAARVDEAYLVAKSGMLYFERMVKINGWDKSTVCTKFASKVRGKISGYPNAFFDIEVKPRTAANEYNIICTGYYGTPGATNTASYVLYKYALAGGPTTPPTNPPNRSPRTDLLDYATGSYDKTLENGFEGSYYILNNTPGGKMTITNTDSSSMTFGKMVTVTDVNFKVGRNKIGSDGGSGSGIISKGKFNVGGEACMVPGSVFCNEFTTDGATSKEFTFDNGSKVKVGFIIGDVLYDQANGDRTIAQEGNLHVATDLDSIDGGGLSRLFTGEVMVAGDAHFTVDNSTVEIMKDLIVGGDLTINISNNGKFIVRNIYVKGDVTITGANSTSITINGNSTGTVYIKNGSLTAIGSGLVAADESAGGEADNLTLYFSNGEENPDFKLYKKIIAEINAEFPNTDRPVTKLPDNLQDGASDPAPVVSSLSDLGAPKTVTDVDGSTKNLYTVSEDTVFDCPMSTLLSDVNTIIMFEAYNGPTKDSDNNITDSSNALDIYFKHGLLYGDPANPGGGKIWINDASHSGCVRFFLADGHAPACMTNSLWPIEAVTDPDAYSVPTTDSDKFKSIFYDNGGTTITRYINYDYVPNLYMFSLTTDTTAAITYALVKNGGGVSHNVCIPAYILMPYVNFNFTGDTSSYDPTAKGYITWDNAPKVHGCLNSNDTKIQNGKQCFVKGHNPDMGDGYTGGNQLWKYDDAVYGVYGYFDGSGNYSY